MTTTLAPRPSIMDLTKVSKSSVSYSEASDADLARAIAAGDRLALETAFDSYAGAVKAMASRVLRDEALAEDVVQDVFVTLWQHPEKFDANRGTLRTFLVTVAHRRAVDTVRSEEARFKREEKVPESVEASIDEQVWSRTLSASVRAALDELGEDERKAITLAYFGGLSYVEVAKRLDAPEGTVKSRIRSGMKKLSVALAEVTT